MKREPLLGFFKAGGATTHRFPAGTLLCSIGLLIGGMRLAGVLPLPSLPRFALRADAATSTKRPQPFSSAANSLAAPLAASPDISPLSERVTLRDVRFQPIQVPLWPMSSRLEVTMDKGRVSVTDPRNGATVWVGPVAAARFRYSNISATQVLKDAKGRVLWSDIPAPDLLFDKKRDGKTRLLDRRGKVLWSGTLPPSSRATSSRSDRRGTTYTMEFAGVRVSGINGYFTVIDGTGSDTRILWSGALPTQPIFLFREDHRFLFWGENRSEAGSDRITMIDLAEEPGRVTLADARSRVMGSQTVSLLKVDSVVHLVGEPKAIPVPHQYCVPFGGLATSGSVLFTYQNKEGRVIHKNSVVRDGDRQRINNNGLPY